MPSNINKIKAYFSKLDFKNSVKIFFADCFRMPFYLITHPIKGFDEFKREKTSKRYVAIFYLVIMIVVNIISFNYNGFLVNWNNPKDFNLPLTIALVIFPVAIFTVGNWATTTLMDGKGTMSDIFRVVCYSFFPYVWLSLIGTIISNFITLEEVAFFTFIIGAGIFLLAFMLFFGLMGIHEYGLFKTILMFVFTIVAIAVILFIILLFLSLIQQMYSFLNSVYSEFKMRFL
ncbi:MAG: Yip1 family protein [Bacilli bacterium]|nr:Yip1 family protein [Bacilli bacterium]